MEWTGLMRIVVACLIVVGIAAALVGAARRHFELRVEDEARALLDGARHRAPPLVEARELEALPAPVRRWLEASGALGHARAATVRLKQRGEMRTAPDKPWMPVEAEQYFSIDPPGFVWRVHAKMARVLPIAGRDRYAAGRGHMLIKVGSLFTVADAAGPAIDQGALLRYLGEIIWFPSAALSDTISWSAIDDHSARATMRYGDVSASMIYTFDEGGRVVQQAAERYMTGAGPARLERWVIPITEWRKFCGIEVPSRGDAVWKLPAGDFSYYRWEIVDIEVNHPALYADEPGAPLEVVR
jgi:hypothetical protein